MAYGDIEITAPRDMYWERAVDEAIDQASWPGSTKRIPIRRNGLVVAYVVGAEYLDKLEKAAGVRT